MTVDQSDLFADVGQHVADVCVRCYLLEAILTDFLTLLAANTNDETLGRAASETLVQLRAMRDTTEGPA